MLLSVTSLRRRSVIGQWVAWAEVPNPIRESGALATVLQGGNRLKPYLSLRHHHSNIVGSHINTSKHQLT